MYGPPALRRDLDPVPARLLGGVERTVGGANQSVDGAPVIRILRDPDRQRDARQRQAAARVLGVLDAVADLGKARQGRQRVAVEEHQQEFLSAVAAEDVAAARPALQERA